MEINKKLAVVRDRIETVINKIEIHEHEEYGISMSYSEIHKAADKIIGIIGVSGFAGYLAKDFAGWVANQAVNGRTYERLWEHYLKEKLTPNPNP